jgi:alpha-L-fucosidase
MSYLPTAESLRQHAVPEWFHDAKLGIFIHWGLYSVPGWAPLEEDPFTIMRTKGFPYFVRHNPYAEWYYNTLQYPDSPTRQYHNATFGEGFDYHAFRLSYQESTTNWDPNAWSKLFAKVGARYVVLTTKHHDGFTLWPTRNPNPFLPRYFSERDLIGELTQAVRTAGMRMGLYYSGGIDWTFHHPQVTSMLDFAAMTPQSAAYIDYANRQILELVERYQPSVLWNDIGYPADANVAELMASYYNQVPEGVINDRFSQRRPPKPWLAPLLKLALPLLMKMMSSSGGMMGNTVHADFRTPEYQTFDAIKPFKWESCRGLGSSFGYNRQDTAQSTITPEALIHSLVDIVSKNGNLLINVGPMADGTIPDIQLKPLLGLGQWLAANGEAIYDTRPWVVPQVTTSDNQEIRFTQKADALYAILLGKPRGTKLAIPGLASTADTKATLVDRGARLPSKTMEGKLILDLPTTLGDVPAYAIKITPRPAWRK